MGNNFSFEPADNFETFCDCKYRLRFKLKCFGVGEECDFNSLRITVLAKEGREIKNFLKFDPTSYINGKALTNVSTTVINNDRTLELSFDTVTLSAGGALSVNLCFTVCHLPEKTPIKIRLEPGPTALMTDTFIIHELPSCSSQGGKSCCINKH